MLCIYLSIIDLSICLPLHLSIWLSVNLFSRLYVYLLTKYMFICLLVYLSVYPFFRVPAWTRAFEKHIASTNPALIWNKLTKPQTMFSISKSRAQLASAVVVHNFSLVHDSDNISKPKGNSALEKPCALRGGVAPSCGFAISDAAIALTRDRTTASGADASTSTSLFCLQ